jgi:hypothetical protein
LVKNLVWVHIFLKRRQSWVRVWTMCISTTFDLGKLPRGSTFFWGNSFFLLFFDFRTYFPNLNGKIRLSWLHAPLSTRANHH